MNYLVKALGCDNVYSNKAIVELVISNINDINLKMIPLFHQYKIEGVKYLGFQDFCVVAELVNKVAHLTPNKYEK